jgi:hypothetical protein
MKMPGLALPLFLSMLGAQDVAPPPKPKDSGPSLEVTMKYTQDNLNAQGTVEWRTEWRGIPDKNWERVSNASADPAGCTLSFHSSVPSGPIQTYETQFKLSFREVTKLMVEPLADFERRTVTNLDETIIPPVFNLSMLLEKGAQVKRTVAPGYPGRTVEKEFRKSDVSVVFREEEAAKRMAKVIVHAVELCGGGDKDPFK